ncbi:class I SAM-dependent methyltransferase [Bdellovibrio sp. HCB-110]|uniref:class I SAM-dependent methyltransferase n=1 Tax=Bdellovibrio sp. HCB-110 TaxID=3391182 RepID=UPI0039B40816
MKTLNAQIKEVRVQEIGKEYLKKTDYVGFAVQLFRKYGWKAIYKQFRFEVARPFSKGLIKKYAPDGIGIEIGVGKHTIAPMSRTVLTDAYLEHAADKTSAKFFCRGDEIPFADETFAFVFSEHMLEHTANPIKVLLEWKRILKRGGTLFLFLPHKERTFDRNRPRTTLQHHIDDYEGNVSSYDQTHLNEWMEMVINRGLAPHYAKYTPEVMIKNGLIHHHVWITEDMLALVKHMSLEVLFSLDEVPDRRDSFVIVARKP